MKIQITCSRPSRSAVLAVQTARELLSPGHEVGVCWPETWQEEEGFTRFGLDRRAINASDIVVHVTTPDEIELPAELSAAIRFGTAVVRYEPFSADDGEGPGESSSRIHRAEELLEAVREACKAAVG